MRNVYIIGGLRSYIGLRGGTYKNVSAEMLGAAVLNAVTERFEVRKIDKIICGNAVGAGGNITRLMSLSAGFNIPSVTVDSQCSSGLEAVRAAAADIAAGYSDCIICGGFESASTQPIREYNPNHPDYEKNAAEGHIKYNAAKFAPGEHRDDAMLRAAEKTAERFSVARVETYNHILRSHRLAAQARDGGFIHGLICPAYGAVCDEGIRDGMNIRLLRRLRPVLTDGGHVTAASSCLINDGAALLALCSEEYMNQNGITPLAEIIGFSDAAETPELAPQAAVSACLALEKRYKIKPDCYEVNEAFALIDVLMERQLGNIDNYNIFGGALAYGHPYGASGAIILLHLMRALERTGGIYGAAAAAAAGGLGSGIMIKRVLK